MMTEQQPQEEKFLAQLQALYGSASRDDALKKSRSKAWEHFLSLKLPNRTTEPFKYIKLRQLFAQEYTLADASSISKEEISSYVYPECRDSFLVFINGKFSLPLSSTGKIPSNIVIAPLSKAARTYGSFFDNHLNKTLKQENDPFATINRALQQDGLFIYIPANTIVEAPLQLIHILSLGNDNRKLLMPHTQVYAGKNSEVQIYASLEALAGQEYMINQLTDFVIDEGAHVSFVHSAMRQNSNSWHFDAVRASLKRNSTFKSINVNDGAFTYRNDYHVTLTQENCEAELDGLLMLSEKRESHAHVLIDHQAPHCRSRQLFKGVLRHTSRSSFEGKILVRQEAQKTDAFQLNNNLLLDEWTHADSKPNLEIFADDVKASHGSTVGRLDEEQLFYLKSRGLADGEAKNILISGFAKEVIERIALPSLRNQLTTHVEQYMASNKQ